MTSFMKRLPETMEQIMHAKREHVERSRTTLEKSEKDLLETQGLPFAERAMTRDISHALLYRHLFGSIGQKPNQKPETDKNNDGRNDEIPHTIRRSDTIQNSKNTHTRPGNAYLHYSSKRMKSPT